MVLAEIFFFFILFGFAYLIMTVDTIEKRLEDMSILLQELVDLQKPPNDE